MSTVRYLPTNNANPEEVFETTTEAYTEAFGWESPVFHETPEAAVADYEANGDGSPVALYKITLERIDE